MAEFEIVDLVEQPALAVRGEVPVEGLGEFFGRAFGEVMAVVEAAGVEIVDAPFGYYPAMPTEVVTVEAGLPVSAPVEASGDVHPLVLPGGRAVVGVHVGPYDSLEATYTELTSWMAARGLTPAGTMWESYLSDPEAEPDPATWRTRITWPIVED